MQFQSTLPTRGSDATLGSSTSCPCDFNPRSPRGGATCRFSFNNAFGKFQSTLPTRGSDIIFSRLYSKYANFNPRSPRGGATDHDFVLPHVCDISIHAPHEGERRALGITTIEEGKQFQSTLPTRGSDVLPLMLLVVDITFQSTLPTRGSDLLERKKRKWKRDFNPRSPRGGATKAFIHSLIGDDISIHAPHEGERSYSSY